MSLSTPIAFIIFNRPDLTQIVFNAIRQAQPKQLFVIADGARFPEEAEKCQRAKDIIKQVDWDCQVLTNYADHNLGCRQRVSTGISWVFEQVEEAIILEDDCLPHPSFFPYCQELLERYRFDTRIMQIGGNNSLCSPTDFPFSYYFSELVHIWGWATWRRAWSLFDVGISSWPQIKDLYPHFLDIFGSSGQVSNRASIFDQVLRYQINTWDYSWLFTVMSQHGLTILPTVNLVSNIGFRDDAVRTKITDPLRANLPLSEITFPLRHPEFIITSKESDRRYLNISRQKRQIIIKIFIEKVLKALSF